MEKNHVDISLARQNFRIVCAETPEYMKKLESAVNSRIERIRSKYPGMSTMRIVLLAMLDMEDDLFKAKSADGSPATSDGAAAGSEQSEYDDF